MKQAVRMNEIFIFRKDFSSVLLLSLHSRLLHGFFNILDRKSMSIHHLTMPIHVVWWAFSHCWWAISHWPHLSKQSDHWCWLIHVKDLISASKGVHDYMLDRWLTLWFNGSASQLIHSFIAHDTSAFCSESDYFICEPVHEFNPLTIWKQVSGSCSMSHLVWKRRCSCITQDNKMSLLLLTFPLPYCLFL